MAVTAAAAIIAVTKQKIRGYMLDYIITHISGHYMNGIDYGAIGGFMLYRILQGSIRRIMYKVEKIIVLYIAIFLGYQLYQYLG